MTHAVQSNVVQLTFPARSQGRAARRAALLDRFANERRSADDVFWLKENAEVLNILESTGQTIASGALPEEALQAYKAVYDGIEKRLGFFPQYYRFFLSIALDLEALGMPGGKAEGLVRWAYDQGLAEAELSDLQRAEARRLMLRRDLDPSGSAAESEALTERLTKFISRPRTFMVPNKKAAYELTHIVFYLSEYGRFAVQLTQRAKESLNFAGTLAYLDLNADLLAEICVAMRYAGMTPPEAWESWLNRETSGYTVEAWEGAMGHDDYHEFLVSNWAMATAGQESFRQVVPEGRVAVHSAPRPAGPLRLMSQCLMQLDEARSADWQRMQDPIHEALSEPWAIGHLARAAEACTDFDAFFAGFSRAGLAASQERASA
ncbi:hypothetical protein SAMN06297129_2620 [Pseudooceanicola antarcticus]|uniref:Uncharacterized protein n=1 Tax=Pseudooceanicola antarcticus TaxID=1247613 RepID=A0A285J1K7_9RHOB|nr:hypothetical protein [Pseudooceanicola antarcticus]PJE29954.1 hypothetical protein CVM39_08680 [Pseudooceanicola antarcticus]SNY53757.1 hypothetical protein SAMN06297129_2620 [Pseudooceanicola antarcticus]